MYCDLPAWTLIGSYILVRSSIRIKNNSMKRIIYLVILFTFFLNINCSYSQEFRGGEIKCELIYLTQSFKISVDLYFKDTSPINQYEFINIHYGHDDPVVIQVSEILELENGIKLYRYVTEHVFIAHVPFAITIMNEFYLDDIVNLSEPTSLVLQTILNANHFLISINNYYPYFENLQTDYTIENGVFRHQLVSSDLQGPVYFRYDQSYLQHVPSYSLPEATNFINLDYQTGEFTWDKPVPAGKYLLAFELIEQGGIGYRERFMIVEIKESDLATATTDAEQAIAQLSIAPNPAGDYFQLQCKGLSAAAFIRIFNAQGQVMYETQTEGALQVSTLHIPVADWPQGVYSVQLQTEGKMLTRQVAVQR